MARGPQVGVSERRCSGPSGVLLFEGTGPVDGSVNSDELEGVDKDKVGVDAAPKLGPLGGG